MVVTVSRWWRKLIPLTQATEHAEKLAEESRRDKEDTLKRVRESNATTHKLERRVRDNHFSDGMQAAMRRKGLHP